MLKRMNLPRRPRIATTTVTEATAPPPKPSRCPPLPLEIWTQIMRTVVHSSDLPEQWMGLRLLSHTLKAALETAFVDEHLACLRGWLYVGDPQRLESRRPWGGRHAGTKRIIPLQLVLSRLSPDRRRAHFVSLLHRNDPSLAISPAFADCTDNTVVAEWLRSARGVPPPGTAPTEGRFRLTIGPDCAWTHWKHHVIGSDGFVVESRNMTFEDNGDTGGDFYDEKGNRGRAVRAIGLEVDRNTCEVSLDWTTLISCVFARPCKTFGAALPN
ncbi:hypothetical protein GGS26DRAFT_531402 [Hypomontagnella submonticulosa]|nr:hypothetical protein GGS26DRAFT_531402 [Hypomontagnella submonticulosa]